ncbi:MAG: DinB family protein [Bacteroidota bacterium]
MLHPPDRTQYHAFYDTYVRLVREGDVLERLRTQLEELTTTVEALPTHSLRVGYAPGKWSLLDLLGHLMDTERVMSYRALCMARGDVSAFPGFDQEAYAAHATVSTQPLSTVLAAYRALRASTLHLYTSFDAESLDRMGTASGYPVSVRALVFITAGHERHHLNHLEELYGAP